MYFIYVDESGDPGPYTGANSAHFILSGIIVNADDWDQILNDLIAFRRILNDKFNLPIREELHASELIRINKIVSYRNISKTNRITILKLLIENTPIIFRQSKIINICLDKKNIDMTVYQDYAEIAWNRLVQRYDNFLKANKDNGIVITDHTDETMIRKLIRRMRRYNPIPSKFKGTRNLVTDSILEDPFMRDSKHSYIIQAVDAVCHVLYRKEYPKGSLKKYQMEQYFDLLEPVLLKEAAINDTLGVVRK